MDVDDAIDQIITRRVVFLLNEAKAKNPPYDNAVNYALRSISNYYTVGRDQKSYELWFSCPFRSRDAHELLSELVAEFGNKEGSQKWKKLVTNEHPFQIKKSWEWIIANKNFNPDQIKNHLKKWPMVVVTKDENTWLGGNDDRPPYSRYEDAEIAVLKKDKNNQWHPYNLEKE